MRLLHRFYALMTTVRPIIRLIERTDSCACGSYQQTKELITGFTGPE
jgi:hypothetical protein